MAHRTDFTLIIHGPLSIYTVFSLYRYRESFPIIIVTPRPADLTDNTIVREIQSLMQTEGSRISLLMYDMVPGEDTDNTQNRYYHFFSVHLALQAVTTRYSIKIRSDEFYSDLAPLIDAVTLNVDKLITTDVFFRNPQMPLHPSDHVVAGNTQIMLDTFKTAKLLCEKDDVPNSALLTKYIIDNTAKPNTNKDKSWFAAEQILGIATILSQVPSGKLNELDGIKLMRELFHIVPTHKLGLFRVMVNSSKGGPTEYFNSKFFDLSTDVSDIHDYIR